MTNEELRQLPYAQSAIERLKKEFPDPDEVTVDEDMGVWINPNTQGVFVSESNDPVQGCVLVYSVIDGEL